MSSLWNKTTSKPLCSGAATCNIICSIATRHVTKHVPSGQRSDGFLLAYGAPQRTRSLPKATCGFCLPGMIWIACSSFPFSATTGDGLLLCCHHPVNVRNPISDNLHDRTDILGIVLTPLVSPFFFLVA